MDTEFIEIIQAPCIANTLKFDNFIFVILKHGMVYNILKSENDGLYIALYHVSGRTIYELFFNESNHTTLRGGIE